MNLIGPQIKAIRESRNMTQEALTAKCNLVGWNISRGTLAKMEAQVRRITDVEVELLCKALKVQVQELFP